MLLAKLKDFLLWVIDSFYQLRKILILRYEIVQTLQTTNTVLGPVLIYIS